jgi:hypothetical protein
MTKNIRNMKEFMLFIKATGNPIGNLPPEKQQEHIQKVGGFIGGLVDSGKLKAAQPLEPNGIVISNNTGAFSEHPIDANEEMIAGYYLLSAKDISEAIEIAKSDPRFNDGMWKMEVRPIMNIAGIN